jgi:hypothetical protein
VRLRSETAWPPEVVPGKDGLRRDPVTDWRTGYSLIPQQLPVCAPPAGPSAMLLWSEANPLISLPLRLSVRSAAEAGSTVRYTRNYGRNPNASETASNLQMSSGRPKPRATHNHAQLCTISKTSGDKITEGTQPFGGIGVAHAASLHVKPPASEIAERTDPPATPANPNPVPASARCHARCIAGIRFCSKPAVVPSVNPLSKTRLHGKSRDVGEKPRLRPRNRVHSSRACVSAEQHTDDILTQGRAACLMLRYRLLTERIA